LEKALTLAQDAVRKDPDNTVAYRTVARCYFLKGDFAKAAENLEHALDLSKKRGTAESEIADYEKDLAHCYASLKQFDKAQAVAQKALTQMPDDSDLHLISGRALLAQKHYVQAYMQLVLGFRQDARNPEYLQPLAEAGINSGIVTFVRQAYPAAVRAEQMSPTRENALLVARGAIALNMQAQAITSLTPWLAKNKNDAEVLYLMSLANEKLGNKEEAAKDKDLALKLDPNVSKKVPIPSININLQPPSSQSQPSPVRPNGAPSPVPSGSTKPQAATPAVPQATTHPTPVATPPASPTPAPVTSPEPAPVKPAPSGTVAPIPSQTTPNTRPAH
jgi:tetratricopeptide (TPR) repeat protein